MYNELYILKEYIYGMLLIAQKKLLLKKRGSSKISRTEKFND